MTAESLAKSTPAYEHWKHIGFFPHHGINIFLPALRTQKSCGIGEYLDLIPILDWMHEIGLHILQLLPLNDTGNDPSPYNALSSCALNPIYLSLHALPFLSEHPSLQGKLSIFKPYCKTQHISYVEVLSLKKKFLKEYFDLVSDKIFALDTYKEFFEKNHYWLGHFSLFKSLKEAYQQKAWLDWPEELKNASKTTLRQLESTFHEKVSFYNMTQFLCFLQLTEVSTHAQKKRIFLKGDVPILISPDSADVWSHPYEFDLNFAAGAPPDYFNTEGQYWGFPLYKWEIMQENGFGWWKRRLHIAHQYYSIFRIDHIIGFFRVWAIPRGESARKGFFIPSKEEMTLAQGKTLIEMMLEATKMFPIGEDLGSLTQEIRQGLTESGICRTKIIRWEKDPETFRAFIPYDKYYPLSMTSVSTHDSETLKLWWMKFPEEARAFSRFKGWNYERMLSPGKYRQILWDSHHTSSLFHINLLQEYLAAFPELSWPNPEDERINIPGTILSRNWAYRFRPWVEEIIQHKGLKTLLEEMVKF